MSTPDVGIGSFHNAGVVGGPSEDRTVPAGAPQITPEYRQTLLLLVKITVVIFLCEAAIMALLAVVPVGKRWSVVVDPVLLTMLAAPALYWMLFRPIRRALEDRKKAEQRLLVYQKRLKSLASQLSLTEERERRRLATELHDWVGQSLILCKIKLDRLGSYGPAGEFAESVQEVCDDLRAIIQRARTLISDLSYPILYDLGLEPALEEWLTVEIQRKHGVKTEFADDGQEKPLDEDVRTVLFRNARELLENVVSHASASAIRVSVRRSGRNIHVIVEDDGIGFDPIETEALAPGKAQFGLLGIRERLEQVGGAMDVVSQIGAGTKVSMTAPLKETEKRDIV